MLRHGDIHLPITHQGAMPVAGKGRPQPTAQSGREGEERSRLSRGTWLAFPFTGPVRSRRRGGQPLLAVGPHAGEREVTQQDRARAGRASPRLPPGQGSNYSPCSPGPAPQHPAIAAFEVRAFRNHREAAPNCTLQERGGIRARRGQARAAAGAAAGGGAGIPPPGCSACGITLG